MFVGGWVPTLTAAECSDDCYEQLIWVKGKKMSTGTLLALTLALTPTD